MLERGGDARLAREALAEPVGLREVGRDDLDRRATAQVEVLGAVHDAHAAAPDPLLDPVAGNDRAEARVVHRVRHDAPSMEPLTGIRLLLAGDDAEPVAALHAWLALAGGAAATCSAPPHEGPGGGAAGPPGAGGVLRAARPLPPARPP